ncbi:MAG TPA: UDP-N-acetylmuramate dehydrogenase [Puia sp.]|nr:UDP-N-acetylmuramate dehydrogenase [Puia sp.]
MIDPVENFSLRPYNTLGIEARARYFSALRSLEDLSDLADPGGRSSSGPLLILGGGSNILFTGDFDGLVLRNELKGIELPREDDDHIYVRAGAGESWHGFVQYALEKGWAGIENLSLIPGSVGAAPMQNIGAYGVEIKDVFHELSAWHLMEKKIYTFNLRDCEFGYRESAFKQRYKDQFIILDVTFRLNKKPHFHTEYGDIRAELERMQVRELSIRAVSEAVMHIRRTKLPDPAKIGNAGSFFKNPTVTKEKLAELKISYPDIVGYPRPVGIKLAAGWLIEQCGWKGFRRGDAGCHAHQALVLVNYGHATGREIYDLSEEILQSVQAKFGVELEREVNIVP